MMEQGIELFKQLLVTVWPAKHCSWTYFLTGGPRLITISKGLEPVLRGLQDPER
jgi:hypothetical protein